MLLVVQFQQMLCLTISKACKYLEKIKLKQNCDKSPKNN